DGTPALPDDLHDIEQRLDLWTGLLTSRFRLDDQLLVVQTCVHPEQDVLAIRIEGDLDVARRALRLAFPYGAPVHTGNPAVWDLPDRHRTEMVRDGAMAATWNRTLDADGYAVRAQWSDGGTVEQDGGHT